jgi:DNA polymerase III subunit chi
MAASDGISATAGSSGGGFSPPTSSAVERKPRVDFYVIEDRAGPARLKLACRLAEKAYLASQRVLIWHTERAELQALDELLWTFADGSFVPHDWSSPNAAPADAGNLERASEPFGAAPVLLSAGAPPAAEIDFVVNLASAPPPFLHLARRVVEIVDGDAARRALARHRFKSYRELGIEPTTHTLHAQ